MRIRASIPMSGRGRDPNSGIEGVFYRIGNRQYVRAHVISSNPPPAGQRRTQEIMGAVAKAYSEVLSEEQRQRWVAEGAKVLSRPRLGRGPLTGQHYFNKINSVLLRIGRGLALWPPERVAFGPNPVERLLISRQNGQLKLKLRLAEVAAAGGPRPPWEDIMVFGEAPCSSRWNKMQHPLYLGQMPAPAGGECDITEMYLARFGEPPVGQRVFIRTQQQRDGWKDRPKDLSAVAPAKVQAAPRTTPQSRLRKTPKTRNGSGRAKRRRRRRRGADTEGTEGPSGSP